MFRFPIALLVATSISLSAGAAQDFPVTTGAGSGPGSLRQAILDVNANPGACLPADPCTITFPPVPSIDSPPLVVRLETPLPALTSSNVRIGSGALWPVAEIHGPGDGLRLESVSNVTVAALSIDGLRGNAIVIDRSSGIELNSLHLLRSGANGALV